MLITEIGAEVSIGVANIFDEGVDNNSGNDELPSVPFKARRIMSGIEGIDGSSRISRLVLMMEFRIGVCNGPVVLLLAPSESCLENIAELGLGGRKTPVPKGGKT